MVLLTALAYIPAYSAGYIWDDSDHVTQNAFQRTTTVLKWIWFRIGTTPQYYPLTHTTFWIEAHLWGSQPMGYHIVNVVLHIAVALLLWRALWLLEIPGAFLVSAIFAVHPVNVESVAWITELKNTLSAFFYLISSIAMLRCLGVARAARPWHGALADTEKHGRAARATLYAFGLFFFILAILSKTVTCTLPAALALVIYWKRGRFARRDILFLTPMFAIALAAAKLTSGMEQWNVGAVGPDFAFTFPQRLLIAGRAVWFYAGKLLWPHPLIFMYPRWELDAHAVWQWLFPAAAAIAIVILWLLRRRIGRGALVAVLFFVGTLFPALGFVDVYPMRFSFVADHFQYLAETGILVLAVQLLRKIPLTAGIRTGAAIALLVALATLSFFQARIYKDETTLWTDTLAKNPNCWLAMDNLGSIAAHDGDRPAAFAWYAEGLAVHPNQFEAHIGLGRLYATASPPEYSEAEKEFQAAAVLHPLDAAPIHELAKLALAEGNAALAESRFKQALAMEPRLEPARMEYANLLRAQGRVAEAESQYEEALRINPDSVDARAALAGMAYIAHDLPDALRYIAEAADLNPSDAVLANNYGVFLMAAQNPSAAAEQFRRAISLDPSFADAYNGLGNALQAQGDRTGARLMFARAAELKSAGKRP